MLDNSVLSQLTKLKADIHASKNYATGTVAGTQGRYGFVRMTDGRDAFLSPEKMDRVLPGDEVEIIYRELDNGKIEADLEKLIHSNLTRFIGQYRIRGKGHFVVPTGVQCNRWIFIPPKFRKQSKDGDFVITEICQHPYRDSKAQARVVFRIGSPEEAYIEHKYIKAKFDLTHRGDQDATPQVSNIETLVSNEAFGERTDLTNMYFVTIDAETTMDMDDALAIELGEGDVAYKLHAAIADPASFIEQTSPLAEAAQKYGQTVYLSGGSVPMLPKKLSNYSFSLEEAKNRPSIVCSLNILKDGSIGSYEFNKATVQSRHKLSYDKVAEALDTTPEAIPAEALVHIELLQKAALLRREYRKNQQLLNDDHIDYDFELDEVGKIKDIHARPRNSAHQVVEEAMLATNMCAGEFLQKHNSGLHVTHPGFRLDRLGEVKALLKEESVEYDVDITTLEGHITLIKQLENDPQKCKLLPALRRLMRGGELSLEAAPHLGLGCQNYATVTSPIRRFADLYNHWAIQSILDEGKSLTSLSEEALTALNETLQNGRQADRELQQWLISQYTQNLIGQTATGNIRIVTQQGFGVRMKDNGIDGFVLFGKDIEKSFDAKRMTLTVGEHTYSLDEEVTIKVVSVDMDKRRIAFKLA